MGALVHRERIPASGTWSPSPPGLAGITPSFVLAFTTGHDNLADDVIVSDAYQGIGFSDGADAYTVGKVEEDGQSSAQSRISNSGSSLLCLHDGDQTLILDIGVPTFVSGGLTATINTASVRPLVTLVFLWPEDGDTWQTYFERSSGHSNPKTINTGFSGTNDNQILFFLPAGASTPPVSPTNYNNAGFGWGAAYRRGAGVSGQGAIAHCSRALAGTATIGALASSNRANLCVRYDRIQAAHECTAIDDASFEMTTREIAFSLGYYCCAVATDTSQVWAGLLDALTASGTWAVNDPGIQPGLAFLGASQSSLDGTLEFADIISTSLAAFDGSSESSISQSSQDSVATMVCKSRQASAFVDVLQSDGTNGWSAPGGNTSLTPSGWQVDNVTVEPGSPATIRKWLAWAIEGEAGPPGPEVLDIDGLTHAHPLDQADVTSEAPSPEILNINGLSHAHDLKEVDLGGNYTLSVDSPTHVHPLDQCAVAEVGANFPLDIDKLTHQHPVDQANLTPTYFLDIDKLTHQHLIDEPEFTIPPNDLVIDNLTHAHPVDESDLGGIYDLNIQGLSHDHPVEQSNLGGLEGDDTALKMTPTQWLARAGVELANTSGVDTTNWHVVEIVFNGVTSVLTIDGVKVEGDVGIRSLEAVILGAGLARDERANIQVGELQLYSGNVPEVDRVTIRNDLTTKWITG